MESNGVKTTGPAGGLVIITERIEHFRSVALGLTYRVGSRDDPAGREGAAHLVEHMVFKGTDGMDARAINVAAEANGAELNAFTDKENTCFYGRFPSDRSDPVTRLLADIVTAPSFNPAELAKEHEVIAEEIRATEEDPESHSVTLLLRALYGPHPMGRPVAGTRESVAATSRDDLHGFYHRYYGPACGVAVAAGDVEHERMVGLLEPLLGRNSHCVRPERAVPVVEPARTLVQTRPDLSQVHVCLARPTFPYPDPRRHALSVLNSVLGGGVASRLFQRLREEEGLVYSVSSFVELYEDAGLLGIYFATDHRKLGRCVAALKEELTRLRSERIGADEMERALNMTRSSVLLALESTTNRMMRLARTYQMFGRVVSVDETLAAYARLTRDEVSALIEELLPADGYHCGAVGPLSAAEFCRAVDVAGAAADQPAEKG